MKLLGPQVLTLFVILISHAGFVQAGDVTEPKWNGKPVSYWLNNVKRAHGPRTIYCPRRCPCIAQKKASAAAFQGLGFSATHAILSWHWATDDEAQWINFAFRQFNRKDKAKLERLLPQLIHGDDLLIAASAFIAVPAHSVTNLTRIETLAKANGHFWMAWHFRCYYPMDTPWTRFSSISRFHYRVDCLCHQEADPSREAIAEAMMKEAEANKAPAVK